MLTPAFDLTQNEKYLFVSIQVPYAKISEIEIHFEDYDFMFFSKPYYLRLNLPGKIVYTEEPSIQYDFDKRTFKIQAEKQNTGEVFEGLDMITLLLTSKKEKPHTTPKIETLESSDFAVESDEDLDWSFEQNPSKAEFEDLALSGQQCGFANTYSFSVFKLKEEVFEIFDVQEPQNKLPSYRKEERLEMESKKFNKDHYIADLYEDDEIQEFLKFKPEWEIIFEDIQNGSIQDDDKISFTHDEKELLKRLPNKDYLLDVNQKKTALLGLLDIIFAYAYNKRTTEGENTVESGWTINKISATLSWLQVFNSVSEVAHTCIRRSLCYPLYRHFELAVTVLEDVRKILLLGRKYVIKCMLEIHQMFIHSEPRYILNDLYITDYCVWLQTKSCSSRKLVPLAETIGKILLTKGDIGLCLVEVESSAREELLLQGINSPTNSRKNEANGVESDVLLKDPKAVSDTESLCANLGELSLSKNEMERDRLNSNSTDSYSEFEMCSSCTSDSSDSSSSTFETNSSIDDEGSSLSDSEASDSSTDSDSALLLVNEANRDRCL